MRHALIPHAVAVVWLLVAGALFAVPPITHAGAGFDLPSPLAGPGVGEVKKSQRKKIERGWRELVAGDLAESRKRAARAGQTRAARLLAYQIVLTEGVDDPTADLSSFCNQNPDYAAAWVTMSIATERKGSEVAALDAARRGAELWSTPPWGDRAEVLYKQWVDDRITHARRLFNDGDPNGALEALDAAEALDPDRRDAILLEAEISFSNDQLDEASSLLEGMVDEPDAQNLRGQIFERREDWQAAMDSYSSLPDDYPGRASSLQRAQILWRLTLLPGYARASMAAEVLTRGDLAVILISTQPRLETLPGGTVPVMSDIVDHPGQREIITVVRLGIMNADRRGHLFYPNGNAEPETVRGAIQRAKSLLGLPAPVWCDGPNMVGSGCTSIPSSPNGGAVVNAVFDSRSGADR